MRTPLCLGIIAAFSSAHAGWEQLAPMPAENGGLACGFVDGKLIVAGGTNWQSDAKQWLDVIWRFDPATNKWEAAGKLSAARAYAVCGVLNGRLVIAGGSDGTRVFDDVIGVSASGHEVPMGTVSFHSVFGCGTVQGGTLLCAGGSDDVADLTRLCSRTWTLTFDAQDRVQQAAGVATAEPGFGISAMAGTRDGAFMFGGAHARSSTEIINLDAVRSWNGARQVATLPHAARGLCAAAVSEHVVYVGGGYPGDDEGFTDKAWLFDTAALTFAPSEPLPMKAMTSLVVDDGWLYCLGGEDRKKHRTDKVWRIRLTELVSAAKP